MFGRSRWLLKTGFGCSTLLSGRQIPTQLSRRVLLRKAVSLDVLVVATAKAFNPLG